MKSKLIDELMPHIKIFVKEKLKSFKQENEINNSNREFIKNKTSKILSYNKDKSNSNNFDLDTVLSTFNSKLVDETIDTCSGILDSSESKTIACRSNLSTPYISEKS